MGPDKPANTVLSQEPCLKKPDGSENRDGLDCPDTQKVETPSRDEPDLSTQKMGKLSKTNEFFNRKKVAVCLVDLGLFAANISQLRIILEHGPEEIAFYHFLMSCLCISLCGQLAFAVVVLAIWERESRLDEEDGPDSKYKQLGDSAVETKKSDKVLEALNLVSVMIILMITILNVCITGFGISELKESNV